MLACARIGAIHSVVFAGFSADALADRILDCKTKVVLTCQHSERGDKQIELRAIVEQALLRCPEVQTTLILNPAPNTLSEKALDLRVEMMKESTVCPCEWMDSEDPLFMLYTSGSTGKPKGLVHTTAGYLAYTSLTHKIIFDYKPGDVYACVADIGWITGHSYVVYGPLANGATTVAFEALPTYPDEGRYWDLIDRL